MSARTAAPTPTSAITDDPGSLAAWTAGLEHGARIAQRTDPEAASDGQANLISGARQHERLAQGAREEYARTLGLAVSLVLAGRLNQTEAATLAGVDRMTIRRFLGLRTQREQQSAERLVAADR